MLGVTAQPVSINPAADKRAARDCARLARLMSAKRDGSTDLDQEIDLAKARLLVGGYTVPTNIADAFAISESLGGND